jgi:NAD(P)-dependent dehydrogenase (short-subunit alcohol dehydrogenase family)
MKLKDKIAVVTGGLSGIGAAVAQRFAAEGAKVVAADTGAPDAPLGDAPIAPFQMDVADAASVRRMADAVLARHGRIDLLVNSAGIARNIPFLEHPVEEFDRIVAVNLRGTFLVGQACAAAMAKQGGGAIVNISSISGMRGNPGRAGYGASKGGVVILSQVMANDLAAHGIRVNVIAPGPIETEMMRAMNTGSGGNTMLDRVPLGRAGTPDEIAKAAVFLCSDDASYMTGHVMAVDGGFTAVGLVAR